MNPQLNIDFARANRDEGIRVAVDHANAVNEGWSDKAYEMFKAWLQGWPKGYCFQIETFRVSASARGLPEPPSARSFGYIAVRARKEGLIKSNGQKATTSPTAHRCFSTLWEKL